MPNARIYLPAKTAMQSGYRNTRAWVLEFEPQARKSHDPLTGWIGSTDTLGQVRLTFESKEDAIAYARKRRIDCRVQEPQTRHWRPKRYADNFRWDRVI